MAYTAQTWTNDVSKLNATRMTVIETGISAIHNLVTAKGDVYTATASGTPARLAVGANNTVLVADSAQSTGNKWAQITNAMVDPAAAIDVSKLAGAFSTYTPTWTGTGGTPSLGNGTIAGRYIQIGKHIWVYIVFTWGSTTTANTATTWFFTLPVTAVSTATVMGHADAFDASGPARNAGRVTIASTTTIAPSSIAAPSANWGATSPMTWTTSDVLTMNLTYEAA